MTVLQFLWNCEHTWHKKHIDKSLLARFTCYCSNCSTSPFVIGNVSTQLSGYLFPIAVLPLTSVIGNMEWNLMMSATESNIWGKIKGIRVNIVRLRVLNETFSEMCSLTSFERYPVPNAYFFVLSTNRFWHCKPSSHDTQPIPRVQSCCWWSSLVPKMHHPNGRSYKKKRIFLLNCAFGVLFLHFQLI